LTDDPCAELKENKNLPTFTCRQREISEGSFAWLGSVRVSRCRCVLIEVWLLKAPFPPIEAMQGGHGLVL